MLLTANYYTTTTAVLRPFFRDHPGEPVPEEKFWTLWCKGRLTDADTPTTWLSATPSGLTSAHHHPPQFFTGQMPFLPPNQQCQSTEGTASIRCSQKSTVNQQWRKNHAHCKKFVSMTMETRLYTSTHTASKDSTQTNLCLSSSVTTLWHAALQTQRYR